MKKKERLGWDVLNRRKEENNSQISGHVIGRRLERFYLDKIGPGHILAV